MNTFSRRSFLKLAGVTAVAAAGASMLTGCSLFDDVDVIISVNGIVRARKTLPYIALRINAGSKEQIRDLVHDFGPEEYRNVEFTFDDIENNCKIIKTTDGGLQMVIAITVDTAKTTSVDYSVVVNGKEIASGKYDLPKGVTGIDKDTATKLANEKKPAAYKDTTLVWDDSAANNGNLVNGKITLTFKVAQ